MACFTPYTMNDDTKLMVYCMSDFGKEVLWQTVQTKTAFRLGLYCFTEKIDINS